jgi:hypothetical protein
MIYFEPALPTQTARPPNFDGADYGKFYSKWSNCKSIFDGLTKMYCYNSASSGITIHRRRCRPVIENPAPLRPVEPAPASFLRIQTRPSGPVQDIRVGPRHPVKNEQARLIKGRDIPAPC